MESRMSSSHTDKEILLLKDQLGAEALTIKKYMDYKADIQDPELGKMVDEMIEKHQGHYNRLLSHIK